MIFPELTGRVAARAKGFLQNFASTPTLDIKSGGFGLDFYARNGFNQIYSIMSAGGSSWSGEPVTTDTALNHSVVFACNRIISECIGFLPLVMMQRSGASKRVADDKPLFSALHDAPSDEMTAMGFRETRTSNCLLQGNGFAKIMRRSGSGVALELHPLSPSQVLPEREREGQRRLVYVVREAGLPDKTYTVERGKPHDILHIRGLGWDGVRGYSVLTMARQSIGTALARERNVARFYANGGRVPYLLNFKQKFKTEADFDKWRADWEAVYSQPHKAPILEGDVEYKQIGLNHADSQLLEMGQFQIPEICRWFAISPHLVGDLSRATFANVEQLALDFVKFTLSAWTTRWEQELFRCGLTPEEKTQGYFFRHDFNALLRGDFLSRMAGYASALQNGHLNQDEVRDIEDRNPLPNGEGSHYRVQLNMQTLTTDPAAAQLAANNAAIEAEKRRLV